MAKLLTEKNSGPLHLKVPLEGEGVLAEEWYFAIWGMGECWGGESEGKRSEGVDSDSRCNKW